MRIATAEQMRTLDRRAIEERGVPSAEALPWIEASDYTISLLDREPEGISLSLPWLTPRSETQQALRSYDLTSYYTVELDQDNIPYAITVSLFGIYRALYWAGVVLLVCQGLSLITGLFRSNRSIHKVLRPIQDLAATAARLNSMTHMSRQELQALAGELEKINARHLDSRIDLPSTQKELRALARAINDMLDRINKAYSAQMRFVSDASHELRTPLAAIHGYAELYKMQRDLPGALGRADESISHIEDSSTRMTVLVRERKICILRNVSPERQNIADLLLL